MFEILTGASVSSVQCLSRRSAIGLRHSRENVNRLGKGVVALSSIPQLGVAIAMGPSLPRAFANRCAKAMIDRTKFGGPCRIGG